MGASAGKTGFKGILSTYFWGSRSIFQTFKVKFRMSLKLPKDVGMWESYLTSLGGLRWARGSRHAGAASRTATELATKLEALSLKI